LNTNAVRSIADAAGPCSPNSRGCIGDMAYQCRA
jgi:hypothetical protein